MTKTPEREFLFVLVFYLIVLLFLTVVLCFFRFVFYLSQIYSLSLSFRIWMSSWMRLMSSWLK